MIRRVAEMGEVAVKVKLTNLYDRVRAKQGDIGESDIRHNEYTAVVDTGAVLSVVPQSVVDQLGLEIDRKTTVDLAGGKAQRVGVVFSLYFEIMGRGTADEAYVMGDEVLIGQTVLEKLDLLVDCTNQTLIGQHTDGPLLRA